MTLQDSIERFIAPARSVVRIEERKGATVTCCSGTIWITQAGDKRDIVLSTGESFVLDHAGLALVFAIADSAVVVGPRWLVPPGGSVPVPGSADRLCA